MNRLRRLAVVLMLALVPAVVLLPATPAAAFVDPTTLIPRGLVPSSITGTATVGGATTGVGVAGATGATAGDVAASCLASGPYAVLCGTAFAAGFAGGYYGSSWVWTQFQEARASASCGGVSFCWGSGGYALTTATTAPSPGTINGAGGVNLTLPTSGLYTQMRVVWRSLTTGNIIYEAVCGGSNWYGSFFGSVVQNGETATRTEYPTFNGPTTVRTNTGALCGSSTGDSRVLTDFVAIDSSGRGVEFHAVISAAPKVTQLWQQCRKPDGSIGTWTGDRTALSSTTWSPSWPSCDSLFPGSHRETAGVDCGNGVQSYAILNNCFKQTTYAPTATATYPACTVTVSVSDPCVLQVWKGTHRCDMSGAADSACVGWRTGIVATPATFECRWGRLSGTGTSYSMPASDCLTAYDPAAASDPWTDTGATASPSATPSTSSTGASIPTSGTYPTTVPTGPAGSPTGDPAADSSSCLGAAWSWNPIDWVLVPVECAMKWAFVPRTSVVVASISSARDAVTGHPPGSLIAGVGATIGGVATGWSGGCAGDIADVTPPGYAPGSLAIPCTPDIAGWSAGRTVVGVGIGVTSAFLVYRTLRRAVKDGGEES